MPSLRRPPLFLLAANWPGPPGSPPGDPAEALRPLLDPSEQKKTNTRRKKRKLEMGNEKVEQFDETADRLMEEQFTGVESGGHPGDEWFPSLKAADLHDYFVSVWISSSSRGHDTVGIAWTLLTDFPTLLFFYFSL